MNTLKPDYFEWCHGQIEDHLSMCIGSL